MTVLVQFYSLFYLARIVETDEIQIDHCTRALLFEISPLYVDDDTWASTERNGIDGIKKAIPE